MRQGDGMRVFGCVLLIVWQDSAWWLAVSGSSVGYVPYNYVERVGEGGGVVNIPRSAQAVMLMPVTSAKPQSSPPPPALSAKPKTVETPSPSPAATNPFGKVGAVSVGSPKPVTAAKPATPVVAAPPAPVVVASPVVSVGAAAKPPPFSIVRAISAYSSEEDRDLQFGANQLIIITTV
jgi:hypothetical protein